MVPRLYMSEMDGEYTSSGRDSFLKLSGCRFYMYKSDEIIHFFHSLVVSPITMKKINEILYPEDIIKHPNPERLNGIYTNLAMNFIEY